MRILIPFAQGRSLFEAASEPKTWYPVRGAGHNDTYLVGEDAYFRRLATFVGKPGQQVEQGACYENHPRK